MAYISKAGACGGGCGPCGCCLYPWSNNGALYPDTGLPDAIDYYHANVYQATLSHTAPFTFDDGAGNTITDDGTSWIYNNFDYTQSACRSLVAIYVAAGVDEMRDKFLNTYTVNGADTITRTAAGSCQWTGPKTGGGTWTLAYNSVTFEFELNLVPKAAPQSSPVGAYGGDTVT